MAKSKMRNCKSCNHEISAKGKVICPSCGAVNKKPVYKRAWFIILAVIVVLSFLGGLGDDNDDSATSKNNTAIVAGDKSSESEESKETESSVQPVETVLKVTVDDLLDALESNALKASTTYKGKQIELTGKLSVIDAQGDYFSLAPIGGGFSFSSVHCSIDEEHLDAVMEFKEDQQVTAIGTITTVGEVLGYTLKVETISNEPVAEVSDISVDTESTEVATVEADKPENTEAETAETETAETETAETSNETVSQRNALRSAKDYLDYSSFSKDGLIKQLEFEGFNTEDATYGADNCGADWMEQANKSAKDYLDYSSFSAKGLITQLEFEGFTNEQAMYGVENCGANWMQQAVESAKNYLEYSSFSRDGLITQLEFEGFTNEQAIYGTEENGL